MTLGNKKTVYEVWVKFMIAAKQFLKLANSDIILKR